MQNPPSTIGLRHVALNSVNLEASVVFYTKILGMKIEWQPDADNIYLTSGYDNLALHRAPKDFQANSQQRLDHVGFMLAKLEDVDIWHDFMVAHQIEIVAKPKTHRDGARSFYCRDPDGNVLQIIYHPPLGSHK